MNYTFDVHKFKDVNGFDRIRPIIDIASASNYGWFFYDEINNLSSNLSYVKKIVVCLESLIKGEIDFYDGFRYEVYMIECTREIAKVVNVFEGDKIEAEIPTREVYELMRDWRDYLIEWESQNGVK